MKVSFLCVRIFLLLFLATVCIKAQNIRRLPVLNEDNTTTTDTILPVEITESDLNRIIDVKKQFEIQNSTFSVPVRGSSRLYRSPGHSEPVLSPEALYWARLVRDPATVISPYMTFRDTIFDDPAFLPPMFRGNVLPSSMKFYDDTGYKSINKDPYTSMYKTDTTLFADYLVKKQTSEELQKYLEIKHLPFFRYSEKNLPGETVETSFIRKPTYERVPLKVEAEIVSPDELDAPAKFIPDRKYWLSAFESTVQFSQNYVSPNWHKGGSSNLNLFTRNHIKYDYNKDRILLTNELEVKVSFYNAPKDTLRSYKIGDDVLRLRSNLGYKAFNKWYYTLNGEFKTQLFKNFEENTDVKQAAFLAPFKFELGLGMKYDLSKTYKTKHKNLKLSVNIAPLSYAFMYSVRRDPMMDLGRHGYFKKKENPSEDENPFKHSRSRLGSTVQADMTMNFSRTISWQSRFYYSTFYENVLAEFENTLNLAITRHFSTRIYAHIRFDDSATKTEDFDSYFQINQLLSFGFNYKW